MNALQPIFVKKVLHKTDAATSRQRKFYKLFAKEDLPGVCNRQKASDMIRALCVRLNKVK